MLYKPLSRRLFVALDESNHGGKEEIFVAAYSFHPDLAKYIQAPSSFRTRRNLSSELLQVNREGYRFLTVSQQVPNPVRERNLLNEVVCSFYNFFIRSGMDPDSTDLFMDGDLSQKQRERLKQDIKKLLNVPYPAVSVHAVPKRINGRHIKTNPLLLLSDHLANLIFKDSRGDFGEEYLSRRIPFPFKR